jgi:CDP-glucose 4,6-dehydratase
VLEPLSGYLALGQAVAQNVKLHGEAFNFGPRAEQHHTVVELLSDLSRSWDFKNSNEAYRITGNIPFHEAGLLKLNCDKALFHLKWESNLNYAETIELVRTWYENFYHKKSDMHDFTLQQIRKYETLATERNRIWTKSQ